MQSQSRRPLRMIFFLCLTALGVATVLWGATFTCRGFYWLHSTALNELVDDFRNNTQIRSLNVGDDDSYESNNQIVHYDSYRFVNGEAVTFYAESARPDGDSPSYYIFDFLKANGIPEPLFWRYWNSMMELDIREMYLDKATGNVSITVRRLQNSLGFRAPGDHASPISLVYSRRGRPFSRGSVHQIAEYWYVEEGG